MARGKKGFFSPPLSAHEADVRASHGMLAVALLALLARCQAALYVAGHCNASVNGLWSPVGPSFSKGDLRLFRSAEGPWRITSGGQRLGESRASEAFPGPEWHVDCSDNVSAANLSFGNVSEAYDLSAEHCGQRLLFRRIDVASASRFLYAAGDRFLSFNCSAGAWELSERPETTACGWTQPREARALCNGTGSNVSLRQESEHHPKSTYH